MRPLLYIALGALLGTCSTMPDALEQVRDLGELRVVTRESPVAYISGPEGPSGPEFDLVQAFADELGVTLILETVDGVAEIVPRLMSGYAHMAAAGLSITDSRRRYLNFGHPYEKVEMLMIYKLGTGKPRSFEDVIGGRIEVMAGSSHADWLARLQEQYPQLTWTENADAEVSDLLRKVADGEIDYTIADSNDFNVHRNFHPRLRVALELETDDPLAWAFSKDSGNSLLRRADDFLIGAERRGLLAQIHDRYYGHTKKFDYVGTRNFIRHVESRLPRYRPMFEKAGKEWGIDWRLLAAMGYQESHWRAQAVSPTGVRGLMMLTQDTADYLGVDDRVDPRNSIFGGAEYLALQMARISDTVDEPDRTWFALAAYNVGLNHVRDAQRIVKWQDGNPDTWVDLSQALPLLAQRDWYTKLPFGYARGWEPVLYVNNIRAYYDLLVWLTEKEQDDESDESAGAATVAAS